MKIEGVGIIILEDILSCRIIQQLSLYASPEMHSRI
jgi:hypothetical protein